MKARSSVGMVSLAVEEDEPGPPRSVIHKQFTPLSAFVFMIFTLFYMPCVIVIIAVMHGLVTWRWAIISFMYLMVLA
jgi:ferrous iron transport protein B